MRIAAALMLLALAACQKTESAPPLPLASVPPAMPVAAASTIPNPTPVLGWTTDGGDFLLLGRQAQNFSGKLIAGEDFSLEKLRGHWTIVGFRDTTGVDKTEETFVSALNSAVDQDPDLDFLEVVVSAEGAPPAAAARAGPVRASPVVADGDHKIASAFGIAEMPTYLLIGPDLTIEAVRGPLAASPDNGIKDVIRGVAEIRKQIADPT